MEINICLREEQMKIAHVIGPEASEDFEALSTTSFRKVTHWEIRHPDVRQK